MAKYKKPKRMTRKELREQDEVMSKLQLVYDFLAKYRNLLIFAAGILIVVLLGTSFIVNQVEAGGRAEAVAFDAAVATVRAPVKEAGEEAAEAVEAAAPKTETFATQAERDAKAIERLEAFLAENDGSALAPAAQLVIASLRYDEGKAAEAAATIEGYLSENPSSPLSPLLVETLGVAAEQQGQIEAARKWFGELAKVGSPYFDALGHAHLGDLLNPSYPAGDGKAADKAKAEYEAGINALTVGERKVASLERPLLESLERRVALLEK